MPLESGGQLRIGGQRKPWADRSASAHLLPHGAALRRAAAVGRWSGAPIAQSLNAPAQVDAVGGGVELAQRGSREARRIRLQGQHQAWRR